MKTMRLWGAALLVAVLFAGGAAAGPVSVRVNSFLSYTDNLFQNDSRQPDWMTLTYLDFDYVPIPDLNIYYTGNASVFAEYEDLFSHRHQAGLGYVRSFRNGNALYAGAEAGVRLDRPVYRYYDYLQGGAYLSGKFYMPAALISRGGYRLRYREYIHAGDYSFLEQSAFGQVSRSWQTGTSFRMRGELGVKTFARGTSDASGDAVQAQSGGAGTMVQAVIRFKVAQALAQRTGLQVEYSHRVNLTGHNRYADLDGYDVDNDLLDDRYSYTGKAIRSTVKHIGFRGLKLEATGRYERRNYGDRPALDLEGLPIGPDAMRRDGRKSLLIEAEKVFPIAWVWAKEVGVRAEWLYLDVDSNDPYYRATTQVYSVGLQVGF